MRPAHKWQRMHKLAPIARSLLTYSLENYTKKVEMGRTKDSDYTVRVLCTYIVPSRNTPRKNKLPLQKLHRLGPVDNKPSTN